jgi:YVTN family beta-propeller protein
LSTRASWVRCVVVLGLAGALVGVAPIGVSAVAARARCRQTELVTNRGSDSVSLIDVRTGTRNANDIRVGVGPAGVAVTPNGKPSSLLTGPATRCRPLM